MRSLLSSFLSHIVGMGCAALMCSLPAYAQEAAGPNIISGVLEDVGDQWQTVELPRTYMQMVVVAVPAYTSAEKPAVVRISNAGGNTFDVRVQNPSGEKLKEYAVHYMVVEAGVYTEEDHGIQMEAFVVESEVVDHAAEWAGEDISYENEYQAPIILGQVMSFNDERWSVFWARGLLFSSPPGLIARVGRHVGEDEDIKRDVEDIGYIVIESGAGSTQSHIYEAYLGADIVAGMENGAPFMYSHNVEEPEVALLASAGMDGANGGWPVLWNDDGLSAAQISVAIDEDQILDPERQHTTEEVAVLILKPLQVFPQLTSFSPARGEAGSELIVQGTLLSGIEEAFIGEIPVSSLEFVSDQEVRIIVPDDADTGTIRLIGPDGVELISPEPFIVTYAEAAAGINLCRLTAAEVSQSSDETPRTGPEKACDGILNGTLVEETIASTNVESEAWWEVDLGAIYNIEAVRMINRVDCCQEALSNFFVFISEAPFVSTSVQLTLSEPSVRAYFVSDVGSESDVLVGHPGRYIRLQYPGEGGLGVSEVEVVAANGQIVQVANEGEVSLPVQLVLNSPFPSPASNTTTFSYAIPSAEQVELLIYDALGREVERLRDTLHPAGTYFISYSTQSLAGGVYVIRLRAGGQVLSRSFVVKH